MADKPIPSKPPTTYISSSGQTLSTLPLSTRLNNATNSIYNLVGLYFVSLLSLDPYLAAQNSRFNTRGPGRNVNANTGTSVNGNANGSQGQRRQGQGGSAGTGGGLFGGGGGSNSGAGPRGGGSGGSGSGRRMGTVDDVRGPECGSCG